MPEPHAYRTAVDVVPGGAQSDCRSVSAAGTAAPEEPRRNSVAAASGAAPEGGRVEFGLGCAAPDSMIE